MGADAGVAAEEGREIAEGGERGVGHEGAGEGREDDEGHGFREARAMAHARKDAQQPRELRRGGGGEATEEVEDERLRRGEGRACGDEELEVGERSGRVGLGFDQLQQAVDGRRLGIGLRRRHRDLAALARAPFFTRAWSASRTDGCQGGRPGGGVVFIHSGSRASSIETGLQPR